MKSRILIIDDNVALTTLLAKALAKFGHEPVVENNPLLAVNTVRHYMPDLILLDVMMPERDGGRVLADLRNDLSLRYIPVVLLTAIAREAQTLAGTGGIQSLVLAKPVQLQELLDVIDSQLRASMSYNQLQDSGPALSARPTSRSSLSVLPDFDREPQWDLRTSPSAAFAEPPSGDERIFAFPKRDDGGPTEPASLGFRTEG